LRGYVKIIIIIIIIIIEGLTLENIKCFWYNKLKILKVNYKNNKRGKEKVK
jgi:hypothetical protein